MANCRVEGHFSVARRFIRRVITKHSQCCVFGMFPCRALSICMSHACATRVAGSNLYIHTQFSHKQELAVSGAQQLIVSSPIVTTYVKRRSLSHLVQFPTKSIQFTQWHIVWERLQSANGRFIIALYVLPSLLLLRCVSNFLSVAHLSRGDFGSFPACL
jgi:hypothetical protein